MIVLLSPTGVNPPAIVTTPHGRDEMFDTTDTVVVRRTT